MDKARNTRPVTLPILKLRLPLAGWVSLLHRVSGVLLFLAVPVALWLLEMSLASEAGFERARQLLLNPLLLLGQVVLMWTLAHHVLAGIRHLLLDGHVGTSLQAARRSARWVMLFTILILSGFIWGVLA